ncbi:MAG TPA: amylo-alpha-1,6-glucosidase [Terriglobales bacterium]|nr:amylo-alpha-1,6-glucosidase [Terriglobales bacterium]
MPLSCLNKTKSSAVVRSRKHAPAKNDFITSLTTAADQYIVSRGDQKSIIAGYHWFSDWGRDAMIALPWLTLPTGRFDIARNILRTYAQHVDQVMLPNRFPDAGETPEYNTVDATLWFFEAVRAYHAYTGSWRSPFFRRRNGIMRYFLCPGRAIQARRRSLAIRSLIRPHRAGHAFEAAMPHQAASRY